MHCVQSERKSYTFAVVKYGSMEGEDATGTRSQLILGLVCEENLFLTGHVNTRLWSF